MNKEEIKEKLKENGAWCTECHTGEEDRYVKIIKAMQLIEQIEEPQKSVVPQSIAVLIEKYKEDDVQLTDILVCFKDWSESEEGDYRDEISWVVANPETFMRAWLIGYEVEKEPLYYVRLPYEVWDEEAAELKTEYLYLHYEITSDETRIFPTKEPRKGFVAKLDELTIKSADERYWSFAVPVEKEETE